MTQASRVRGLHHIATKTACWNATLEFYVDVLGFRQVAIWGSRGSRCGWLDIGDGMLLEVFEDEAYAPAPNGALIHVAVTVDSCNASVDRARSAGARITMEPKSLRVPCEPPVPVRVGFCQAPEGTLVEFLELEPQV